MSQISLLIDGLKRLLKVNNLNYSDVARSLNLSEASVKRLFSQKKITLERLEAICQLVNIEISELFQKINRKQNIHQLKEHEEIAIASDIKLLLVATCVVNHWSLSDILECYDISYHECIQKLAYLDKIKVIELRPKDKIHLKISSNFTWLPNGPIKKFFDKHLQNDFLETSVCNKNEFFTFRFGMLTEESSIILCRKLQELADKYTDLVQEDITKTNDNRQRSGLLLSFRPWIPKLFDQFKKIK